jgi:hypothetical protein
MGNPTVNTLLPSGYFDSLKIAIGQTIKTIGETSESELRTALAKLNIEGAHSNGKNLICHRYQQLLARTWDEAGKRAVDALLENNIRVKSCLLYRPDLKTKCVGWIYTKFRIPGGVLAKDLPGPDLYRAMAKLKVPGITTSMGWQDLCLRLGVFVQRQDKKAGSAT